MLVSIFISPPGKVSAGSLDTGATWSSVNLSYKKTTDTNVSLQVDINVNARNGYAGTHSLQYGRINLLDTSGNKLWSTQEFRLEAYGTDRDTGHDSKTFSLDLTPFPNGTYTLQLTGTLRSEAGSSNDVDDKIGITIDKPITATLTPEQAKQLKDASQNASLAKDYAWNSWQATLNLDRKIDTVENNLKNAFDSRLSTVENNLRNDISNLNSDLTNKLANINTSISNLQNFVTPTLTKVSGYNKATATKDSTFKVSLEYSAANEYRYNIDGSGWSTWTSLDSHDNNGYFTIGGISGNGVHTVVVEIRQATTSTDPQTKAPVTTYSPAAKGKYSFFKL
ncbi:hypothetical protein HMPREF0083_04620 [Aneurinibacillus aneurinilyticus ATCC 12856]|uniref:BppU N-terminal domain-containing protein n=3 Tax=Aneurinibacillus aneurinilyticus TaxID=1391 RepID=U1Y576_ANEAE|nr:hypothetical protein HMPREF0083_04620 [Aneurinibacillus aneurinilyticus ATCC 12856]